MRIFLKYCQLSFIILIGYPVARADKGEKESISPKEVSAMYTAEKAAIVDVREDSEWNEQRTQGTIHSPLAQLNERLAEIKQ